MRTLCGRERIKCRRVLAEIKSCKEKSILGKGYVCRTGSVQPRQGEVKLRFNGKMIREQGVWSGGSRQVVAEVNSSVAKVLLDMKVDGPW